MPNAVLARNTLDWTSCEDAGSGGERRTAEAAHISEGLDCSGALVEESRTIGRAAGLGAELVAFEDSHRCVERLPLPRAFPDLGGALLALAAVDRPGAL